MRTEYRPRWSVTSILLISTIACFILQKLLENSLGFLRVHDWFALSVDGLTHGRIYQLITFQFMHGGILHLVGNLIGLYFFGRAMEDMLGGKGLLLLYFLSGTIGGLVQIALGFSFPHYFGGSVVGASAGVYGLIAAFATRAPDQQITLLVFFIIPLRFPAKVFLLIFAGLAIFGIITRGDNIAHAAHLGGMLTGIIYVRWIHQSQHALVLWQPFRRARPRQLDSPPKRTLRRVKKKPEELPSDEFISREVDPILEKISAHGIHSLTDRERQILEAARTKMAKR